MSSPIKVDRITHVLKIKHVLKCFDGLEPKLSAPCFVVGCVTCLSMPQPWVFKGHIFRFAHSNMWLLCVLKLQFVCTAVVNSYTVWKYKYTATTLEICQALTNFTRFFFFWMFQRKLYAKFPCHGNMTSIIIFFFFRKLSFY